MNIIELLYLSKENPNLTAILNLILKESSRLGKKIEIYEDEENCLFDYSYGYSLFAVRNYKTNENNGWSFKRTSVHYDNLLLELCGINTEGIRQIVTNYMITKNEKVVVICRELIHDEYNKSGIYNDFIGIHLLKKENCIKGLINAQRQLLNKYLHFNHCRDINEFEIETGIHPTIAVRKVLVEKNHKTVLI